MPEKGTAQGIVDYWRSFGQEMKISEMKAYSDNGPVRNILRDILKEVNQLPACAVEIGACMLQ